MAVQENTWNVANRMHSNKDSDNPALNHIITGADEIYDDAKGKKQTVINAENDIQLASHESRLNAYTEGKFVTVSNYSALPDTGAVDTVYRVSSWDGTANNNQGAVDVTKYSEYAWQNGAYKFLDVKTQISEVFDISEYNSGTVYTGLADALGNNGINVPSYIRRGGMSVKFKQVITPAKYTVVKTEGVTEQPTGTELQSDPGIVSGTYTAGELSVFATLPATLNSSMTYYLAVTETVDEQEVTTYTTWVITYAQAYDNKYVQYRLMSDSFNTTTSNWQGVDDEPTAGSDNLVKSGGIIVYNNKSILKIGYLSCNITISENDNTKTVNFGAGYCFAYKGIAKRLSENQSISFNSSDSFSYIFVDLTNGNIVVYSYNNLINVDISLLCLIGVYATNKVKIYTTGGITVNGSVIVPFTQNYLDTITETTTHISDLDDNIESLSTSLLNVEKLLMGVEIHVLPSDNFMPTEFSTYVSGESPIYYNRSCIISEDSKLKKISIFIVRGAGERTLKFYLINISDYSITKTYEVDTVYSDANKTCEYILDNIPEGNYYIGFSTTGNRLRIGINANSSDTEAYSIVNGAPKKVNYTLGYTITVESTNPIDSCIETINEKIGNSDSDIAELLSKYDNIVLDARDYEILEPIIIGSGKSIKGSFGKTRIILTNGCTTAFVCSNANDVKISDLEIVGTCPDYAYEMNGIVAGTGYEIIESGDELVVTEPNTRQCTITCSKMGNEVGIYLYYAENVVLENLKINHINGIALRVNHTGMNYIKGLNACNLFITNCFCGIWCENEHEFSQYTNFSITICQVGIMMSSGNLVFSNGHISRGMIGMALLPGYNHAHGVTNSIRFAHNQLHNIYARNIIYGHAFGDIAAAASSIYIENSRYIVFSTLLGHHLDINVVKNDDTLTGANYIDTFVKANSHCHILNTDNLLIGRIIDSNTVVTN